MRKSTWYEILEVSENASPEVIEKAYKVLVKKYHPDLQTGDEKAKAENKMKQINEAYAVLGDNIKRKEYDENLKAIREQEEKERLEELYERTKNDVEQSGYTQVNDANIKENSNVAENNKKKGNFEDYEKERAKYYKKLQKEEEKQRREMQENLNKEYQNAYEDYLRSLGYRVKHGWNKERIKDLIIVIIIACLIITILWFVPPTHDWMVNFYEENPIIKTIISIIGTVITGIFNGIWEFITGLFE